MKKEEIKKIKADKEKILKGNKIVRK